MTPGNVCLMGKGQGAGKAFVQLVMVLRSCCDMAGLLRTLQLRKKISGKGWRRVTEEILLLHGLLFDLNRDAIYATLSEDRKNANKEYHKPYHGVRRLFGDGTEDRNYLL